MESPYSCCFIKEIINDKSYKSCYPIESNQKSYIDNFAIKYKNDNNLDEEPNVICLGNYIHFSFFYLYFFNFYFKIFYIFSQNKVIIVI